VVAPLLLHAITLQLITYAARPTASYRALDIGVSASWLGLLSASFALLPLALAVPADRWTDRWGERVVMLMGVNGHLFLPIGGQQKCPLVATETAQSWPTDLPTGGSVALAMVGASSSSSG